MNLKQQPAKFLVTFTLTLGASVLADVLASHPLGVDLPITTGQWVALFFHFTLWLAGIVSWGSLFVRWGGVAQGDSQQLGIFLALGSLAYSLVGFVLAFLGLLRPELRYFLFILQAVGIALGGQSKLKLPVTLGVALIPLWLLMALFFIDSLVISPYWDPLHHQLASVRIFWEQGRMYYPLHAIASYQEGGFEMLFLWPHFFFAQAHGKGLLPVQIFAQLTHFLVGFGGSCAIAHSFARRWISTPPWQAVAVILFAAPASLQFAIPTAKNDWGIILWVLGGFWLLTMQAKSESQKNRNLRLGGAGLLWGYAFLAKLSCGFTLAPLLVWFFFRPRKSLGDLVPWAFGIAIGALPFAIRNFIGTGDPVFPLFPQHFHLKAHIMGPTWRDALAKYQANPLGLSRLKQWAGEFPFASSAFAVPLLAAVRKEDLSLRALAIALPIGAVTFGFFTGEATELRLVGALLPISGLLIAVFLQRISGRIPIKNIYLGWIVLVVVALLLPYRWEAVPRAKAIPYNNLLVRGYVSGEAQGWFRDHFVKGMRAALLSESRIYHSIPFPVVRLWDAPSIDVRLRAAADPLDFVKVLRSEGFTHLILSQEKLDVFYPKELVGQVERFVLSHPETFVFQTNFSVVVDLQKFP